MSSCDVSSLPIDRDSVQELKEKLMQLEGDKEDNTFGENEAIACEEEADEICAEYNEPESTCLEVELLLEGMGMEKYINVFKQEHIDLKTFLSLTEEDLEQFGVMNKKDRRTIIRSIGEHKEPSDEFIVTEDHTDDYQISKNVQNHMTLIQNYCGYIECQMKKNKLVDYKVTPQETALTFLKEFTNAAIKQTEIISKMVYQKDSTNHLIGKLLVANDLSLPEELAKKLIIKKRRKMKYFIRRVGAVGVAVLLVFAVKKLLKK